MLVWQELPLTCYSRFTLNVVITSVTTLHNCSNVSLMSRNLCKVLLFRYFYIKTSQRNLMTRLLLHFWHLATTFRIWSSGKKNPYLKYVPSHFLILTIELRLVRLRSGASFTFELHCSLPFTPSLLLLFRFTYENMLFCFIWLDWIVKSWVSNCFDFIPTKVEQQL